MDRHGFQAAKELIEQKTRGDLAEEPKNAKALDAWLLELRKSHW